MNVRDPEGLKDEPKIRPMGLMFIRHDGFVGG